MNSFNSLNNKQHHPSNESNKGKHHLSIKPSIEKHNPSNVSNNGAPKTSNNGAPKNSNKIATNTLNNNENITCNSTNESSIEAVNKKFKIFVSLLNSYKKKNNNKTTINNTKVHEIYQAGYCFLNELKRYFQTQITIKNKSKSIKNIMYSIANKDPMEIISPILKETNDLTQNIEILKDCKDCNKFLSNLFGEGNQQEKAENYIRNINQLNTIFKEVQNEE